ncbi:MAG: hypothetical protein HC821_04875 [Lewinella sp.]|nr:hypothetical protein [Lewinella sp.]
MASKGYVVAAIEHPESSFQDAGPFAATLYHRRRDLLYVLDQLEQLSQARVASPFAGLADVRRTTLIGYSMGGFGTLNALGAGFSEALAGFFKAQTGNCSAIDQLCANNPAFPPLDERIVAAVVFAPWGMNYQAWTAEALAKIKTPLLIIGGDQDDISDYEKGIKAIFDQASNSPRYLLTFQGARHNVAPNPAPPEALTSGLHIDEYLRYADSVWDTRRMNNINQHFITAFLGQVLSPEEGYQRYLQLSPRPSNETPWEGFLPRTAVGLELLSAGQP